MINVKRSELEKKVHLALELLMEAMKAMDYADMESVIKQEGRTFKLTLEEVKS